METKKNPQVDLTRKRGLFFTIGLVITCLFVISAFEWKSYAEITKVNFTEDESFEELIEIPITDIKQPPPVIQQPEVVEVPDTEDLEQDIEVNLDVEFTEEAPPKAVIIPKNQDPPVIKEEKPDVTVFFTSEVQAAPKGGYTAFYKYVQKNLKYPPQARRIGIEGKVVVQFIIEKDGSLTDIKVLKGIGSGCDEEAVRVLKAAPHWNPGKQRGNPVRVRRALPIKFSLR
ncbi:energy transducer TonB [Microscilla marina]|uniref:TonB n=1 Tax=Microscilla marina ATCC 23134 TaxID=313606 RepID=A1ZKM1_MICM2|nr:energy transducer TonB [Microscilla marina]EAY29247.1 TonB [Microscilla marina ATCC 23134]